MHRSIKLINNELSRHNECNQHKTNSHSQNRRWQEGEEKEGFVLVILEIRRCSIRLELAPDIGINSRRKQNQQEKAINFEDQPTDRQNACQQSTIGQILKLYYTTI